MPKKLLHLLEIMTFQVGANFFYAQKCIFYLNLFANYKIMCNFVSDNVHLNIKFI